MSTQTRSDGSQAIPALDTPMRYISRVGQHWCMAGGGQRPLQNALGARGLAGVLTVLRLTCRSVLPMQLDASQEDIFREVIPDGSAKALSRYTDMVDALIREQNDRLAGASDDARLRLRERDLPDCLQVGP